jgi:hypothetical protein
MSPPTGSGSGTLKEQDHEPARRASMAAPRSPSFAIPCLSLPLQIAPTPADTSDDRALALRSPCPSPAARRRSAAPFNQPLNRPHTDHGPLVEPRFAFIASPWPRVLPSLWGLTGTFCFPTFGTKAGCHLGEQRKRERTRTKAGLLTDTRREKWPTAPWTGPWDRCRTGAGQDFQPRAVVSSFHQELEVQKGRSLLFLSANP